MPKIPYHDLQSAVEALPEDEARQRLFDLLQAIDPGADCVCSDLSQVTEDEIKTCAHHATKVSWILHVARVATPDEVLPYSRHNPAP
jgi:hypothetical protein